MSKIVITSDIHFGVAGRTSDILWACRTIKEYCKAFGVDVVLILGDLFHDRQSLNIEVLSVVSRFFEETAEVGQKWIVFPGNHDMFLRHSWEINSLTVLRKHLTVIEDIKMLTLDDHRFWVLPFITHEKSYMRVLRGLCKKVEEGDCLLTHIGVCGATLNTCFLLENWSVVNFDDTPFKRVYTGHFHTKQQLGERVWYPGSPIPFKFDEGDIGHGFYVLDLDEGEHKFINIWKAGRKFLPNDKAPPQFCTFLDELLHEKTDEHVANNMVRVALQRDYTQEEKRAIKDRLIAMGARGVRWMNLNQRMDKVQAVERIQTEHKDLFRMLYESDTSAKDLNKDILFSVHNEVVREGDELYALEAAE